MTVFVFDIETIPDTETGRKLYGLEGLTDEDVAKAMYQLRRQNTGHDFLPLHLHKVVAISIAMRSRDTFRSWSLGDAHSNEAELVTRFFEGLDKYTPVLVSWNGSGFDLPVLHYRSMLHSVPAARYWEAGDGEREFRYNNYLSRYHWRHIDLMDVLAGFNPRANAPLDQVAIQCGFPGKLGMAGSKVWDTWLAGDIDSIRNYCETDVLNTYLLYLRFEHIRGKNDNSMDAKEQELVAEFLENSDKPHLREFLDAWRD